MCNSSISFWSVQHDKKLNIPMQGVIHQDQDVISCLDCGRMMHTDCVRVFKTEISGRHVLFTTGEMRAFVQGNNLAGYPVAFCRACHDRWIERIPGNYVDAGRVEEAALFLEEQGRFKEAGKVRRGG